MFTIRSLSLSNSILIISNQLVGSSKGTVYYSIAPGAKYGKVNYALDIENGGKALILKSLGNAMWNTPSSWREAGNVIIISYCDIPSYLFWDVQSLVDYEDGKYRLEVLERNAALIEEISCHSDGTYRFDAWNDW
jgi:hypothetical protein